MAVDIRAHDDGLLVEIRLSGKITGKTLIEVNELLYSDDSMADHMVQLWDCSGISEYIANSKDMKMLAGQDLAAAKQVSGRAILLVMPTDLQYGLAKVWNAFVQESGINTRVFRDRESADSYIKTLKKASTEDQE